MDMIVSGTDLYLDMFCVYRYKYDLYRDMIVSVIICTWI